MTEAAASAGGGDLGKLLYRNNSGVYRIGTRPAKEDTTTPSGRRTTRWEIGSLKSVFKA